MKLHTICKLAAVGALLLGRTATPARVMAQGSETVLHASEAQKLLPPAVYFAGQSAPAQLRNSAGVKFANGHYLLATLVDTSGYSTGIAANYQAYLITEEPVRINGQRLPAGVYGVGFRAGDKFVVMDIGAHDLLTVNSTMDAGIKRPMPLLVTADPGGGFRLYEGRKYVHIGQ